MRYLVKARLKNGKESDLHQAIKAKTLGLGSVAGNEYQRNMREARIDEDGTVSWVSVCFCSTPLIEERPYWEAFFDLEEVKDAHARKNCRDSNGQEAWACSSCDCTAKLEDRMRGQGEPFLPFLVKAAESSHSKGRY